MKFACIGAALQDVFLRDRDDFSTAKLGGRSVFDKIELGAKVDIDNVTFSTGGGATNAAVTFARQGFESDFIGTVGDDIAGMTVVEQLRTENVGVGNVCYSQGRGTGYSVMLVAPDGERTALVYRGASNTYDTVDADVLAKVNPDWAYITTLSGDFRFIEKLWDACEQAGAHIMFNPGTLELEQKTKLQPFLQRIEVLLVNKQEAQILVQGEELEDLAADLRKFAGAKCVIVSDGLNGAVATTLAETVRATVPKTDKKAKDKTGAGDAFGSGFLSRYAAKKSLTEAMDFGIANASSVVSQIGAKAGILKKGIKK